MSITKKGYFQNLMILIVGILQAVSCRAQVANVSGAPPETDQVMFQNGDRLSGVLLEASADSIRFKTVALGEVAIKWDSVKQIISNKRWVVLNPQKRFDERAYRQFSQASLKNVDGSIALKLDNAAYPSLRNNSSPPFRDQHP